MEPFQLIRQFFTRMSCRFCEASFNQEGIHLIGRGSNYFVVALHCHECGKHNGDAAVGLEQITPQEAMEAQLLGMGGAAAAIGASQVMEVALEDLLEVLEHSRHRHGRHTNDPELTPADIERLADLPAINDDDVLEAHEFFSSLDGQWLDKIPKQFREDVDRPSS